MEMNKDVNPSPAFVTTSGHINTEWKIRYLSFAMLKHFMNRRKQNLLPLFPGLDLPGYNTDEREEK